MGEPPWCFLNQRPLSSAFSTPSAPPSTYTFKLIRNCSGVLRLGCFRRMEGHHSPLLVLAHISLRKSPVIDHFLSVQQPRSLQAARDHSSVSINTDIQVGCCVVRKLHSPRACEAKNLSLRHHGHLWHRDL